MDLDAPADHAARPHRLVFLDETGTTTKMARLQERSPKGKGCFRKSRSGHWKTQTFIAGLRCDALTAPFVIDAADGPAHFELTSDSLAQNSWAGDVVVLDNLPAHKSAAMSRPFAPWALGSYSFRLADLNPIEMAFAKLKALLRTRPIRTIDALWRAIGEVCDLFSPQSAKTTSTPQLTDSPEVRRSSSCLSADKTLPCSRSRARSLFARATPLSPTICAPALCQCV